MVHEKVTIVQTSDGQELKKHGVDLINETTSYSVSVPVLVNFKLISPGDELVLEWNQVRAKAEKQTKTRETSAFEQLKVKAAKKAKT